MQLWRRVGEFCLELFLLTLIVSYGILLSEQTYVESDFRIFYSAAVLLEENPRGLYDFGSQQEVQDRYVSNPLRMSKQYAAYLVFVYPPFYLLPFVPLTYLSPEIAYRTLQVILVLVPVGGIYVLHRLFPPKKYAGRLAMGALAFAPVYESLRQTHLSGVVLLLFIGIYLCFRKKRNVLAGLLVSLLTYKIQLAVVLLLYILVSRNKRALIGFLVGALVLGLLSLWLVGGNFASFLRINFWYMFLHESEAYKNIAMLSWQGLFSAVEYFLLPSVSLRIMAVIFSIGTLIAVFLAIPKRLQDRQPALLFSILILTTLLGGLHVHQYEGVLLLFPLYVVSSIETSWKVRIFLYVGWIVAFFNTFTYTDVSPFYFMPALYLAFATFLLLRWVKRGHSNAGAVLPPA